MHMTLEFTDLSSHWLNWLVTTQHLPFDKEMESYFICSNRNWIKTQAARVGGIASFGKLNSLGFFVECYFVCIMSEHVTIVTLYYVTQLVWCFCPFIVFMNLVHIPWSPGITFMLLTIGKWHFVDVFNVWILASRSQIDMFDEYLQVDINQHVWCILVGRSETDKKMVPSMCEHLWAVTLTAEYLTKGYTEKVYVM